MGADEKGRQMEVVTVPSYEEMSLCAAEVVCAAMRSEPNLVLGLPTGATPIGMYRHLVLACERGQADFSQVRTFNLDEYLGLAPEHPASYHTYMREHLLNHVNLAPRRTLIPYGAAPDPQNECRAYEDAIAEAGHLDLAVLGIGQNGHVGFNEPGAELQAEVHVACLSSETRRLAFKFWKGSRKDLFPSLDDFPDRAITMGMGTILKAKRILLLASGQSKAQAVSRMFCSTITTQVPASFLQLHGNVTVLIDSEAASLL